MKRKVLYQDYENGKFVLETYRNKLVISYKKGEGSNLIWQEFKVKYDPDENQFVLVEVKP